MKPSMMEVLYEELVDQVDNIVERHGISRIDALTESLYFVKKSAPREDKRKAFQYAYLKQAQLETVQPNHQLTPDSIGYIMAYIITTMTNDTIQLMDIGSGTGHLSMVMHENVSEVELSGVEIDTSLAELNAALCEYLEVPMDIYPQNAFDPLMVEPFDVFVGDLPIGIYPHTVNGFITSSDDNRHHAHVLLMERAMQLLKSRGLAIFVVPSNLFEVENSPFKKLLKNNVNVLMFLNLPESVFSSKAHQKSIIVLQKGERITTDVLVGDIPTLKSLSGMTSFLTEIDAWYDRFLEIANEGGDHGERHSN